MRSQRGKRNAPRAWVLRGTRSIRPQYENWELAVGFEQAAIKVEREKKFTELKSAIERIFAPERVEQLLQRLHRKGIRIRDFDLALAGGFFEEVDEALAKSRSARRLYESLTLSDQAQIREFYLAKIEEVDSALRHKFKKLYQYY